MARIRTIKPEFWEDVKIGKLSRDARLLYIGMWNFSDDLGVIIGDSTWLKAKIFPLDQIQNQQFEKWIQELVKNGFISLFSFNKEEFYYLPNLTRHQVINKPNYDRVFVKRIELERVMQITEQSRNTTVAITEQSRPIEERKGSRNGLGEGEECKGGVGGNADGVPPPTPPTDPLELAFSDFQKWIKEHAPRVAKMKEPFTITQYRAVKTKFAPKLVADTLRSMHNYEPLLVKNRSANLTFRKWAEKDLLKTPQTNENQVF